MTTEFGLSDEEAQRLIAEGQARADATAAEQAADKPPKPEDVPISRQEVDDQLDEISEEIKELDFERLVILNKDGTVHLSADGIEQQVFLSKRQMADMKDRITIHNHPLVGKSVTSFSTDDIVGGIQRGELESHVVAQGKGHRFKMSYSDSIRGLSKNERFKFAHKVGEDYNKELRVQAKKMAKNIKNGRISQVDATLKMSDESWKVVGKKHGLNYKSDVSIPLKPKPPKPVAPKPSGQTELDKSLDTVRKEIKGLSNERIKIMDPNGAIVDSIDGSENSIFLTNAQEAKLAGRVTIHNHPNQGYSFSNTDVIHALQNGELESHVIGQGGQTYKMNYSSVFNKTKVERDKIAKRIKREFPKVAREEAEKLMTLVRAGKMKIGRETASLEIHNTWVRLADKHGFEYVGNPKIRIPE